VKYPLTCAYIQNTITEITVIQMNNIEKEAILLKHDSVFMKTIIKNTTPKPNFK